MHAHSDLYLLTNPSHEAKITQGCTVSLTDDQWRHTDAMQTEVVGQDGISYAPTRSKAQLKAIREQIAGWNGNPTDEECDTSLSGIGMFEWKTIKGYLDCLDRNQTATNVAMLCPQVR